MVSYRHLEVFHAIMRTGSITAAAHMLNVSQPAVSSVLQHAEAHLKIRLFERTGGRLKPTPESRALLPAVEAMMGRMSVLERQIQDLAGGRLGTLSLAAAFPIANGYMAEALAAFLRDRPDMQATLQSLSSAAVIDSIIGGETEVGVVHEATPNPGVEAEVLVHSGVACIMPTTHPLADRAEIDVAELAGQPVITYLPQSAFRVIVDRTLGDQGIVPKVSVQVGLSLTGLMLAYHGAGIALVEPFLLASLPLPGLVARPLRPRIELRTLLVRAYGAPRSVAAEEFVAQLKKTLRENQRKLERAYGSSFGVMPG